MSILITVNISAIHTIYISGPPVLSTRVLSTPVFKNKRWYKESKILYNALKDEIKTTGGSVELFPKRIYRSKIEVSNRDARVRDAKVKRKLYTKKELLLCFDSTDESGIGVLEAELVKLILKRASELEETTMSSDTSIYDSYEDYTEDSDQLGSDLIRLVGHGRGGELLIRLKNGRYRDLIGPCVIFEGHTSVGDTQASDTNTELPRDIVSLNREEVLQEMGVDYKTSHKTEIAAMITAIVGLISGILALL